MLLRAGYEVSEAFKQQYELRYRHKKVGKGQGEGSQASHVPEHGQLTMSMTMSMSPLV